MSLLPPLFGLDAGGERHPDDLGLVGRACCDLAGILVRALGVEERACCGHAPS